MFLLDEEDRLVTEPSKKGEICVSGTALLLGYYNDPRQTKAAFMQNPLNRQYLEPIYRTGDPGYYGEDRYLYFASRKDHQIKHISHRIELGEIETALEQVEGMRRGRCIYGEEKNKIVAFYEGELEKRQIVKSLGTALPTFMAPNVFIKTTGLRAHAMRNYGDKGTYIIESDSHLELLEQCACEEGIRIRALIRVISGNQFGMDEAQICRIIERRNEYAYVNIIGLQHYFGTQKKKLAKLKKELAHLDELTAMLKEAYGYESEELEYGPGFYVPYFSTDEEVEGFLSELRFQGKVTLEIRIFLPPTAARTIGRFDRLARRLCEQHSFDLLKAQYALQLMLWGFFKKLVWQTGQRWWFPSALLISSSSWL